jgi:hypothetical protein
VVYALIFGWKYAVGFVLLLLVYEMGYYLAAKHRGLPMGAPTSIPFFEAWIQLKQMLHDAETAVGKLLPVAAGVLVDQAIRSSPTS